jgi:exosortase
MATELSAAKRAKPSVHIAPPESSDRLGAVWSLIVVLSFAPLFLLHGQRLWALPHYQFFPFILIGGAVLIWSRWKDAPPLVRGDSALTFAGIAASWALLAAAEIFLSSSLGVVAALVLLGVLIHGCGGWPLFLHMLPAWIFLWLLVPLPFGFDRRFVMWMQTATSTMSSWILDLLGVYHRLSGNVVEIAGNRLMVEEACAGVNSLFSLIACCLFLIFFLRRPWLRAVFLVLATLGWVIVCNVIRVTAVTLAADRWQFDLASGLKHDMLGVACFLLAVCLIWSTDRFLLFLKPRWSNEADAFSKSSAPAPIASFFAGLSRSLAWPAAIAFVVLLGVHLTAHGLGLMEGFGTPELLPTIATINAESLPGVMGKWKQAKYEERKGIPGSAYGEFSKRWEYRRDLGAAVVSFDYPFPGFHDLKSCYQSNGWAVEKEEVHAPDPKVGSEFWVEVKMRDSYKYGYLLFAIADSKGTMLEPESTGITATLKRWEKTVAGLKGRLTGGADADPQRPQGAAYQFQTFVESTAPFSEDDQKAIQALFFESTRKLHNKLFPQGAK